MADIIKKERFEKNTWWVRGTPALKKKLDEARIERIKNGLDKDIKSYSELLDASARYGPLWDILKKAELKTDFSLNDINSINPQQLRSRNGNVNKNGVKKRNEIK